MKKAGSVSVIWLLRRLNDLILPYAKPVLGIRGGGMLIVCCRRFGETNEPDTIMSPMEQKAGKIAMEEIASAGIVGIAQQAFEWFVRR